MKGWMRQMTDAQRDEVRRFKAITAILYNWHERGSITTEAAAQALQEQHGFSVDETVELMNWHIGEVVA